MKRREIDLERLFAAARTAPVEAVEPMPEYLKTRIWARSRTERKGDFLLNAGAALRLGLGLAFGVMIACIVLNYNDLELKPSNDVELANVGAYLDLQL